MEKKLEKAIDLAVVGLFVLMALSALALIVLGPLHLLGLVGAALPAALASFIGTIVFLILSVALALTAFPEKNDRAS